MNERELATAYAINLANRERDALGFLPGTIYRPAFEDGRAKLLYFNGEPAGFVLRGTHRPVTKIFQMAVEPDLRYLDGGTQLWMELQAEAVANGVQRISLHCAEDLESNKFWESLGMKKIGQRQPKTQTCRVANKWDWQMPAEAEVERFLSFIQQDVRKMKLLKLLGIQERFLGLMEAKHRRKLFAVGRAEMEYVSKNG